MTPKPSAVPRRLAPLALAAALPAAGCVPVPSKSTFEPVRAQANPADGARRTLAHFTPALRCMDARMSQAGAGRFRLDAKQRFARMHTATDLYNELPPPLRRGDFDEARLKSFDEITQAFARVALRPVVLLDAHAVNR